MATRGARGEIGFIALLAALCAVRVIVYASAFPFFHNIDEYRHVDRVLKYARGYWPEATLPLIEPELGEWIARFGTPEYTRSPEELPSDAPEMRKPEEMSAILRSYYDAKVAHYRGFQSLDTQQPPLYPLAASAWYRLGRALGLEEARALYWVRWANGAALAALVLMSWAFLRRSHPDDAAIRLGVPLWIAAYPNDLFYGITDDVPIPLLGGFAFFAALHASARTPTRAGWAAASGAALALALLVKSTALFFVPVFAALAVASVWRGRRSGTLGAELRAWSCFAVACAAPWGLWVAHNLALHGDPTGIQRKYAEVGIARMPPSVWLQHPLMHPGAWPGFIASMTETFWAGEFNWRKTRLSARSLDLLYVATSVATIALAAFACFRAGRDRIARRVEIASVVAVATALAALAAACIVYHYTGPRSSARHYIASSRFVVWAVAPFAICFVRGLQVACGAAGRFRNAVFWTALAAILLASLLGEIAISQPVFASRWNWFHLP